MRVPLNWLADYVDIVLPPEELARRLTMAGVEVGDIMRSGEEWEGIRVAEVVKVDPHPDPEVERLRLATVELDEDERHTVVCGAPNIAPGQKVAFAGIGTRLIDGRTGEPTVLKAARKRGVESAGMVLSEKELGISEQHEGILVLPDEAEVGAPLSSVLGETVFDLDLTPNRGDLLSVLGVAREVAALSGGQVRDPSIEHAAEGKPIKGRVAVQIAAPDLCPRYVAALVENIKVTESPSWLQERLLAAGLRPINNVVDVTNYVMLEMGQPLHAFDFAGLRGGKIIVRRAGPGETLTLLDGTRREMTADMLVIADAQEARALAGLMGGSESEVTERTTAVLLESANFSPAGIRRTSQALKARTDASIRFEKGLSPRLPPIAAQRATKLLVEICGGHAAEGMIDVYPVKEKEARVDLTQERLHRVLGVELPATKVRRVLESLGFGCRWVPPDRYIVRVPYWRTDVKIPDDLVEEVARIVGYDQLPTTLLSGEIPAFSPQPLLRLRETVRDALAAAGMQEVINYSLTTREALAKVLGPEELAINPPLRVANPMSREYDYCRPTLRASLLECLAKNVRSQPGMLSLYEVGRVYLPRDRELPREIESVCGLVTGRRPDRWGQPTEDEAGFYDAKGLLENALDQLHLQAHYEDTIDYAFLPGRTAEVRTAGERIGLIGQLHPRVTGAFGIKADVAMFELDLDALLPHVSSVPHYQPVSPYPSVEQDLAIILPEEVPAARAVQIIKSFKLVRDVRPFDEYKGTQVPRGHKSLAFAVSFHNPAGTLTDEQAGRERGRIIERLKRELGAEPRS
ncbi:MAG: phenylalanine--tRNA ligase subunit beta [Chloroflexi bacterium]|nr:MAG: phenylalanine--tRNA ligase subunit beta [Chloroflexota bacterium]